MNNHPTYREGAASPADGVGPAQRPARRYRLKRGDRNAAAADRSSRIPLAYAWLFAATGIGLESFFCLFNPYHKDLETLALAALVFGLAGLPMVWFLFRGRTYQVPAFEAHCLFLAFCFGFAGFMPVPESANQALAVKDADLTVALRCSLLGVAMLLAGYYVVGSKISHGVRRFGTERMLQPGNIEWMAWCSCLAGIGFGLVVKMLGLSGLGQLTGMLSSLGVFALLVLAFGKRLSFLSVCLVWCALLPYTIFYRSGLNSGQLAGVVTLACWIGLIILRTKGHVPVPIFLAATAIFLVLQPVKFHVRELAWNEGQKLGPLETVQAYRDGFKDYYGTSKAFWRESGNTFENSFNRINHLSTMAAIIRDTPSKQPFTYGASYYPLFVKMIPRAIWPNKPEERLGNDWARRYSYLGENDMTTSFNLAWLPEMFMNFGWAGVAIIMLLLGILFRFLWLWLMENPQETAHYIVAIVVAQSLVFTESNMSIQLGGAMIFVIFLWLLSQLLSALGLYVPRAATVADKRIARPPQPAVEPGSEIR